MAGSTDFQKIFNRLKKNFEKYDNDLTVTTNNKDHYSLDGPYSERFKKNLWFGAVQIKKNYVSYHLMPVYMYKELSQSVSDELTKRMQGKSCFNFKTYDEGLFDVLEKFTDKCFKEFKKRGDKI